MATDANKDKPTELFAGVSSTSSSADTKDVKEAKDAKEKSSKRKLFPGQSSIDEEGGGKTEAPRAAITKRRRSSHESSSDHGSSASKSQRIQAPLSERQQLALIMQKIAAEEGQLHDMGLDLSPRPPASPYSATTPKLSAMEKKVSRRNGKGETPLHMAAIRGNLKRVRSFLKAGADVNVQDHAGWTPLHEACNHGHYSIAKLLLKSGANVNIQGLDNDTPLHDAACNGHIKLIELLLRHGANPLQPNCLGRNPLDVAVNDQVLKLLKSETIASSSGGTGSGCSELHSPSPPEDMLSDEEDIDVSTVKKHKRDLGQLSPGSARSLSPQPLSVVRPTTQDSSAEGEPSTSTSPSAAAASGSTSSTPSSSKFTVTRTMEKSSFTLKFTHKKKMQADAHSTSPRKPGQMHTSPVSTSTSGQSGVSEEETKATEGEDVYSESNMDEDEGVQMPRHLGMDSTRGKKDNMPHPDSQFGRHRLGKPQAGTSTQEMADGGESKETKESTATSSAEASSTDSGKFKSKSKLTIAEGNASPRSASSSPYHFSESASSTPHFSHSDRSESKGEKPSPEVKLHVSHSKQVESKKRDDGNDTSMPTSSSSLQQQSMASGSGQTSKEAVGNADTTSRAPASLPAITLSQSEVPSSSGTLVKEEAASKVTAYGEAGSSSEAEKTQVSQKVPSDLQPSPAHMSPRAASPYAEKPATAAAARHDFDSTSQHAERDSPRSDKSSDDRLTPKVPPLKIIIPPKSNSSVTSTEPPRESKEPAGVKVSLPYIVNPTQGQGSRDVPAQVGSSEEVKMDTSQPGRSEEATEEEGGVSSSTQDDSGIPKKPRMQDSSSKDGLAETRSEEDEETASGGLGAEDSRDGMGRREDLTERRVTRSQMRQQTKEPSAPGSTAGGSDTTKEPAVSVKEEKSDEGGSMKASSKAEPAAATASTSTEEANVPPRKRKLRQVAATVGAGAGAGAGLSNNAGNPGIDLGTFKLFPPNPQRAIATCNPYRMYKELQAAQEQRRFDSSVSLRPTAPRGFQDYLINTQNYILQGKPLPNRLPHFEPPPNLPKPLLDCFLEHEKQRKSLATRHQVERDKMKIAMEQEILRLHSRATRQAANLRPQLSAVSVLRDQDIFNHSEQLSLVQDQQPEDRSSRGSRCGQRMLISWLKDEDDKFEKLKESLCLRHHHEAESLHAVHKMEWGWKLSEVKLATGLNGPPVSEQTVPMVPVNEDWELLPC